MGDLINLGGGLYLDSDGVVYTDGYGALLQPYDGYWKQGDKPFQKDKPFLDNVPEGRTAKLDTRAPYRCSRCGTDRLQVFSSDDFETSARCPDCKIEAVVHDG